MLTRNAAERIAALIPAAAAKPAPPDTHALKRFTDIILIGDFLDPIDEIEAMLDAILSAGVHAHLVQVIDPIEETFPYRRPHRVPRSRERPTPCRLARRAVPRRLPEPAGGAARTPAHALPAARLDLHRPPHRPPGNRTAAGAARAPGRPPQPRRRCHPCRTRRMTAFAFTKSACWRRSSALPAIWYFLRLMPPKPRLERFPADPAAARHRPQGRAARDAAPGG